MTVRRSGLLAIAALACASAASPAGAQSITELLTPGDPARLLSAFKAICIDPGDDPKAQGAAATAAPWKLKYEGSSKIGAVYSGYPLQVSIAPMADGTNTCTMVSSIPDETDLARMTTVVQAALGIGAPVTDTQGQGLAWAAALPDGRSVRLSVKQSSIKIAVITAYKGKTD